jgi:hypothetical protein
MKEERRPVKKLKGDGRPVAPVTDTPGQCVGVRSAENVLWRPLGVVSSRGLLAAPASADRR